MKRSCVLGVLLVSLLIVAANRSDAAVLESKGFRLDLYSSFEFEYQLDDEGNGDPNGSFDSDQIDLAFNYESGDVRFALDFVAEHGFATEDGRGNFELSFGFVEYTFDQGLKLRAGKFFTPFGIHNERLTVRSSFLTVKEPWSTNKPGKLTESGFRFFPRRMVGIAARGELTGGSTIFEYDVTLSNGEQEETNPFEEDDNSQKAVGGRLNVRPGAGDLVFGVSAYFDQLGVGDESADQASFGIHGEYQGPRLTVRAEWVSAEIDPALGDSVDQDGLFVDLGYRFGKLTPYVEYQTVDVDGAVATETGEAVIAGLFVQLRNAAAIKVENGYFKGSAENPLFNGISGRDYYEAKVGFVIGF